MISQNTRQMSPSPQVSGNAIMLDGELVDRLYSAVNQDKRFIDRPASKRECIDVAVSQMNRAIGNVPIYRAGQRDVDSGYKYFDSEISRVISQRDDLADKGRYVEACIIGYLYGRPGLVKYCVAARKIKPRVMSQQEIALCAQTAAEIAEAKDVESKFLPTTFRGDI